MIVKVVRRYASRVVQRAHARVTAENARYVREAIERDAEVERLTQERDRANEYVSELEEALRQRDADHAEVSGRLQDALDRLGGYEYAEAIADETRAKRYYDGLGD